MATPPTLGTLWPEIKLIIAELVYENTLMSSLWDPSFFQFRLVSRDFAAITEKVIIQQINRYQDSPYRYIHIDMSNESLKLLQAISRNPRLSRCLQHVIVVPRAFNPEFADFDVFKSRSQPADAMETWFDYGFYLEALKEQRSFLLNGYRKLATVVSQFSLQKITLTDEVSFKWPQRQLHNDSPSYFGWRSDISEPNSISWDVLYLPLWTFLRALHMSHVRVACLEFKGIPTCALWTSNQSDKDLIFDRIMGRITKLAIGYYDSGCIHFWSASRSSSWKTLLDHATELEDLQLHKISQKRSDGVWCHVEAGYWPALRLITLERLSMGGDSLLTFIKRHLSTLRDVGLLHITLTSSDLGFAPWPMLVRSLSSFIEVATRIEFEESMWQKVGLDDLYPRRVDERHLKIVNGVVAFHFI